jgi:hypothetical protein
MIHIANAISLIDITNVCVLGSNRLLDLWRGEYNIYSRIIKDPSFMAMEKTLNLWNIFSYLNTYFNLNLNFILKSVQND